MATSDHWLKQDATLAADEGFHKLFEKYSKVASDASIATTKAALEKKNHKVTIVENGKEALEALQNMIPEGASVYNTSSTTLIQIGYIDYLKSATKWKNMKAAIVAESDPAKQADLRRQANAAEYAVTSCDAITEEGDFVAVDASGTRIVVAHSAGHTIYVVGANKIVSNMADAQDRARNYCYALESARVRKEYGWPSSNVANEFVCHTHSLMPSKFHFIIIKESLGF